MNYEYTLYVKKEIMNNSNVTFFKFLLLSIYFPLSSHPLSQYIYIYTYLSLTTKVIWQLKFIMRGVRDADAYDDKFMYSNVLR